MFTYRHIPDNEAQQVNKMPIETDTHPYDYRPTADFEKKLRKVASDNPPGYERIKSVIVRLLSNPGDADGKMKGQYGGRLKKYVGRSDYRIIYHWCEVCRKENRRIEKKCKNCDILPDKSVIFFDLYHKKDASRFKRMESNN